MSNYVDEYIKPKEAELIIQSCVNPRDKLILRVMWETGARVSEVLALKANGIDVLNNCLILKTLKQKRKGKDRLRRVYLFPESTLCRDLIDWCDNIEASDEQWAFPGMSETGRVSSTHIWHILSNVSVTRNGTLTANRRKDGIATKLRINKIKGTKERPAWPHLFRHGAAMYILSRTESKEVVQKELGHASMESTEVYAQLSDDKVKEIMQRKSDDRNK